MAQFPPVIYDAALQQHRSAVAGDTIPNTVAPEKYDAQAIAPVAPLVGDHWLNTSLATVAGVPAGRAGRWNGTAWDVVGTGVPETYTAAAAAPVAPNIGDRWRNTNVIPVAGIPLGRTATWNGATWDLEGTGETYTSSTIAPVSPNVGDHWFNSTAIGGAAVSGVEPQHFARWNGILWEHVLDWRSVPAIEININGAGNRNAYVDFHSSGAPGTLDFDYRIFRTPGPNGDVFFQQAGTGSSNYANAGGHAFSGSFMTFNGTPVLETFTSSPAPPAAPSVGDHWQNTTAGTVSGVQAGQTGVWTGAVWLQTTNPHGLAIFAAARNRMVPGEYVNPGAPQEMAGFASGVFTGTTPANGKYTFTFTTTQPDTAYKIFGVVAAYDNSVTGAPVSIQNIFADVLLNANIANKTVNGFELLFAGKINNTVGGLGSFWATPFDIYCVR